jgi:hypothetical protein
MKNCTNIRKQKFADSPDPLGQVARNELSSYIKLPVIKKTLFSDYAEPTRAIHFLLCLALVGLAKHFQHFSSPQTARPATFFLGA